MLKTLKRYNWASSQNARKYPAYIDLEAEMLKKKFRQLYKDRTEIDFDRIPEVLAISRTPSDTFRNLWLNRRVAGCVRGRDGFPELNFHHPKREIHDIFRDVEQTNGTTQPFMLSVDDDSEYFKVTIEDIHFHEFHAAWPMLVMWNRFIPGKPNRMRMRVVIDNFEQCEAKLRGGRIVLVEDFVDVLVYTETWPKVIKANFDEVYPGKSYTVRDLEKDLPDGIEMAPEYKTRRHEALYQIQKNTKSHIYWEYLKNRFDSGRWADVELALMNMEVRKEVVEEAKIKESSLMSKTEEEKLQKLAVLLGKDFESMKKEILASRLKKAEEEAKKAKEMKTAAKK
jgi:hypothetical protein